MSETVLVKSRWEALRLLDRWKLAYDRLERDYSNACAERDSYRELLADPGVFDAICRHRANPFK